MNGRRELTSIGDGFRFPAHHFTPPDARRGGLVLIHDRLGVTSRLLEAAAGYADDGYEGLCPSLFDRRAGTTQATPWETVTSDLQAAIDALAPPVFILGFGWGGTAAWLAAARCAGVAAVASYDGEGISGWLREAPRVPIILHVGRANSPISSEGVEAITAAYPDLPIHVYDATPGFGCDRPDAARPDAARLARLRTLRLFTLAGGGRGEL